MRVTIPPNTSMLRPSKVYLPDLRCHAVKDSALDLRLNLWRAERAVLGQSKLGR
jgi:hypothetical protein